MLYLFGLIGGMALLGCGYYIILVVRFGRASQHGEAALVAGKFDVAEKHLRQALKIAQEMPGKSLDREALAWLELSLLASKRGLNQESIHCATRAIEAMEGVNGDNPGFRRVFAHVADVLEENGEFEDAVHFRRLDLRNVHSGASTEGEAATLGMIRMGRSLKRAQRSTRAESAYASVWKRPRSSNAAVARMEMAGVLNKLGKHADAESELQRALTMLRTSEGNNGASVAEALSRIGTFYADSNRLEDALRVYQESLEIRGRLYGRASESYAVVQNHCANCLRKLDRLSEAEAAARAAVNVLMAGKHPALPNALDTLGLILRDLGRLADAESCLAQACLLLKNQADPDMDEFLEYTDHHAAIL